MNLYLVKVDEVTKEHSESFEEAKGYALDLIRMGVEANIDCYAVSPTQPTPVITYRHDPELCDWVKSTAP